MAWQRRKQAVSLINHRNIHDGNQRVRQVIKCLTSDESDDSEKSLTKKTGDFPVTDEITNLADSHRAVFPCVVKVELLKGGCAVVSCPNSASPGSNY